MLFKLTLLVASSAVLLSGIVAAVELVELSDANRAILSLDMAKSLRIVQDGYSKNFSFGKVAEARKFVEECKYLRDSLSNAGDDDFQGLAGKIKAVLAEPSIKKACKIKVSKLDQFTMLDEKADPHSYLSNKRLDALSALDETLECHPKIKLILSHLLETTKNQVSKKLLLEASNDATIRFGEQEKKKGWFDIPDGWKEGCAIAQVKPVCQFARRSNQAEVTAIGADFADLKAMIDSGDQTKLNSFAEASGVSLDDLKVSCQSMKTGLHPLRLVDRYAAAKFISQQQILDTCKIDPMFDFYYQLNKLCSTQESQE